MSQVNARQKLRRLIRMAFAATPTQAWLASALMLGVSTNALFAQAPATVPAGAQQSISDSPKVGATAGASAMGATATAPASVPPEVVMKWLNTTADAVGKKDIKTACDSFARAVMAWPMMSAPSEQVNSRFKEVEKMLLTEKVTQQQIQASIDAIRNANAMAAKSVAAPPTLASGSALPPLPGSAMVGQNMAQQSSVVQAGGPGSMPGSVQTGVFNPNTDSSRMQQASNVALQGGAGGAPAGAGADELYRLGVEALGQGKRDQALEYFRKAWQYSGEMDPAMRSQLKDKLAALQAGELKAGQAEAVPAANSLDTATQEMMLTRSRLMSEITGEIAAAEARRADEPQMVAERLQALRSRVSQADLDGNSRKQMLQIVDRAITTHQLFMTQNRAAIDQNMKNRQINEQVAMEQEQTYKIDQQVASLTETYNDLMEEGRFSEAEVVAKQVGVLKPNSTIATLLYNNARMAKRDAEYNRIRNDKADNFTDLMIAADEAMIVPVEKQPLVFGDVKDWNTLSERRNRLNREQDQGMSPAAIAIYERLKQPVQVDFKNRPLSEVVKVLSDMTGILMHIDPAGLATEGLTPDKPVTLSLGSSHPISLKSALNLLLNEHNLNYRVENEVLFITSARNSSEGNIIKTYSVKDLVIPIPNFVTDYNSGLGGALRAAYETLGAGLAAKVTTPPMNTAIPQLANATVDPNSGVLGQVMPGMPGGMPGGGVGGLFPWNNNGPISGSNPGMMQGGNIPIQGGPAPAKYDDLISLIQQTIDPDSWQSNGGSSTITPFAGNLSLVVSAPQTTHEKLADLLASLRRLQDLQVTIEVRFVTLNDNFFERMGVDFDFKIDDNNRGPLPQEDQGRSVTIGLQNNFGTTLAPTADLDLTFTQDNFTVAPPFGGSPSNAANFGFAILSDIEMFFFLTAAQGDQRTSVLQAPRVTMFDGQQASINDTVSRPFVVSLIPVVGDFAVGQQPVIVVINEGTTLNVQAVVSQDKRFVRLTLNPTFSRIDRVEQFTFQGTSTSNSGTAIIDPATGLPTTTRNNQETVTTGTTVQQPVFATTSVSTTVSVPDGGTILLGGIKRMSEGRVERGVPILSKIPYVNRLFKNSAIGRSTSTLMLTVTPRIIIQEEEEAILLGNTGP